MEPVFIFYVICRFINTIYTYTIMRCFLVKKFLCYILIVLVFSLISCNNEIVHIENNSQVEDNFSDLMNIESFNRFDLESDNIKINIDGKESQLKLPIYIDKNRYIVPLNELVSNLDGSMTKEEDILNVKVNNNLYRIDEENNTIQLSNKTIRLKKNLMKDKNVYYISFIDFCNMLNLHTRWDKESKIIKCNSRLKNDTSSNIMSENSNQEQQLAFIRFEDVCVTSMNYDKDYFENLRIIANYMSENHIPYHIAWIPRYVNVKAGIDNDPCNKNSFEIAEMVYTLDYITNHGGIIGLHGYTHQINNEESGVGFEFGRYNPSVEIFETKIKKAIKTADYLDIPIDFFEVPHYEITPEQNKVAEKYFRILYYPFNDFGLDKADLYKPQLSPYNNLSYYISTPLDYINELNVDGSLKRIKNEESSKMGSVFYHPRLEGSYIHLIEDQYGSPDYNYDEDSILKQLINILEEKHYKISNVKKFGSTLTLKKPSPKGTGF